MQVVVFYSVFSEAISYCWTCLVVFPSHRTFKWQWRILLMWPLAGVWMMTYHMMKNRNMNQVKMQSYLLLVSPHQLSSSSDEEDISNEEKDACRRIPHGVLAASFTVYDRSSLARRTSGDNSFTATTAACTYTNLYKYR